MAIPCRLALTLIFGLLAIAGCSVFGGSAGGTGSTGGGGAANPGKPGIPGDGWSTGPLPGGTFGDALPGGPPKPLDPVPGNPAIVIAHPGQANLRSAHPYEPARGSTGPATSSSAPGGGAGSSRARCSTPCLSPGTATDSA